MGKKKTRQELILKQVSIYNRVLLQDLAKMLDVSVDTVRRDIIELDQLGQVKKVHGGAISSGYKIKNINGAVNQIYAAESKIMIAKKAIDLVPEDGVVLISGGTTNLKLVRELPDELSATFFTPSLSIATELLNHTNLEVIFIGGRMSKDSQVAIGGDALNSLAQIKADICFLGTGYLDAAYGLSDLDYDVVQLKKAMINASSQVVCLTISEKLNSIQRYKICETNAIDTLITELDSRENILKPYLNQNINIM